VRATVTMTGPFNPIESNPICDMIVFARISNDNILHVQLKNWCTCCCVCFSKQTRWLVGWLINIEKQAIAWRKWLDARTLHWWAVTAAGCCWFVRVCVRQVDVGRASEAECRATWPATAVCLHRPAKLFESESSNYCAPEFTCCAAIIAHSQRMTVGTLYYWRLYRPPCDVRCCLRLRYVFNYNG